VTDRFLIIIAFILTVAGIAGAKPVLLDPPSLDSTIAIEMNGDGLTIDTSWLPGRCPPAAPTLTVR
jgi:hypothetical protein